MGKKLYIGNLAYSVTSERLAEMFGQCGSVESARVITDRDSGRSKGFAFIEMSSDVEAEGCIRELSGQDLEGRQIRVSEAKPQESRSNGGGFRGRY